MQNLAYILVAHGEFLAQNDVNLQERHCTGQPVKLLADESVSLDRRRSHKLHPFFAFAVIKHTYSPLLFLRRVNTIPIVAA